MIDLYLANALDWCKCNNRCPDPYVADWSMPPAFVDVYYRYIFQIPGAGGYAFSLIDKPEWVNVFFDSVTGRIRIEGTPSEDDVEDDVEISFAIANCGRSLDEEGITVTFDVMEGQYQLLVDQDTADIIDVDGQLIDTD